jgi:hypothetical protein
MDRLSLLLGRFSLRAGVFYTGSLCGVHDFDADPLRGHIHLVKQGPVDVIDAHGVATTIVEPSLLFLPRPDTHRLIADDQSGAQVLCATVQFGGGGSKPDQRLPAGAGARRLRSLSWRRGGTKRRCNDAVLPFVCPPKEEPDITRSPAR